MEFNNKPAAVAYAEALGVSKKIYEIFYEKSCGIMINNEPYVRSPQQIKDNNVIFYCNVFEGMELSVLESTNIIEDTQRAVRNKSAELGIFPA